MTKIRYSSIKPLLSKGDNITMIKRTIKKEVLVSQNLDETKEILIFLPQEEQPSGKEYPLLLLHDGPDYFNLGRVVTQATRMISEGQLQPFAMAAIPVDKKKRTSQYSPVGEQQTGHIRMVMEELLPLLSKKYPVSREKEKLVIGGSSLGGTVSLHIALKYPDQVINVFTQSGAFLEETCEEIMRQNTLFHMHIYQSIGTSETEVPTHMGNLDLVTRNREVYRYLKEKEAQVHYMEKDGDHTWGFWQQDLPDVLKTFFS